ncbi:DMP19 family protein [Cellulophaga sp. Z1A5H]|uniref:DMP19 family protein n=1 Tax=Cellulophaga sp. Z1A5H TaxID=2687291 RepID=UPI0013FDC477|nr:DMP19 family protein [Cellulophaga sp. Z1A5H]
MEKESFSALSWMTEEMKDAIRDREKIVQEENIEKLFSLRDNSDFSIALYEILVNRHDKNPNSLNQIQLNLFLSMHMENAGQADSILSFLQERFPEHKEQIVKSLNEIGAIKSSKIIKQAIELLPENDSWFFDSSDENSERIMMKLDSEFSNYPDGPMEDLYFKYAEKHKNKLEKPTYNNTYK